MQWAYAFSELPVRYFPASCPGLSSLDKPLGPQDGALSRTPGPCGEGGGALPSSPAHRPENPQPGCCFPGSAPASSRGVGSMPWRALLNAALCQAQAPVELCPKPQKQDRHPPRAEGPAGTSWSRPPAVSQGPLPQTEYPAWGPPLHVGGSDLVSSPPPPRGRESRGSRVRFQMYPLMNINQAW